MVLTKETLQLMPLFLTFYCFFARLQARLLHPLASPLSALILAVSKVGGDHTDVWLLIRLHISFAVSNVGVDHSVVWFLIRLHTSFAVSNVGVDHTVVWLFVRLHISFLQTLEVSLTAVVAPRI